MNAELANPCKNGIGPAVFPCGCARDGDLIVACGGADDDDMPDDAPCLECDGSGTDAEGGPCLECDGSGSAEA